MRVIVFFAVLLLANVQLFAQQLPDQGMPDLIPYRKGDLWGFCNQEKSIIIPPIYLWVEPFNRDIAWVSFDSLHNGVINKAGRIIFKVNKDTVLYVSDSGRVYVRYNNQILSIIEPDGSSFTPKKFFVKHSVGQGMYLARKDNRYGIIDRNENILIPFKYSYISDIDEQGFFLVRDMSGRTGYINLKGDKLFKFLNRRYELSVFSEGLASVSKKEGNKEFTGFINREGNLVLPRIYKMVGQFKNGLCKISENFGTGFINTMGDTVISFKYGDPKRYPNGYISYDLAFSSMLFDKNGNLILQVKYDYLNYINDSFIVVGKKQAGQLGSIRYGVIDISGKEIWPCSNYSIYGTMDASLIYVAETWHKRYYMDYKFNRYYED